MEISHISSPAVTVTKAGSDPQVAEQIGRTPLQQSERSVAALNTENVLESAKTIAEQAQQLNGLLDKFGQGLVFTVDETTNSSVVKVIDKTTEQVIRQFPTEGSLKIMQNIQDYLNSVKHSGMVASKEGLTGTLFNEII
ncbi:flagellar protein FlaG [Thiomicrorhabdus cannonii]|uniref:flagellar protein FlaG n=1 Tax=Thiomicrorhabdus cannonii TaxID=2748011 RepID=UPI0015BB1F8E|nr:flagellar protein FlaG [Thiomicrorhabdus cannonii]